MDKYLFRTLDANTNRLCEGLRVLEDIARFRLEDTQLSKGFRNIRHIARMRIKELCPSIESSRDTEHDIGRKFTPGERHLQLAEIVRSNSRRGQESLRVIEENLRLSHPSDSVVFEKHRYRLYELEKDLLCRLSRSEKAARLGVYVLVTESMCRIGFEDTLRQCAAAGAGAVQIREKDKTDAELAALCKQAKVLLTGSDTLLIINDRPDIAAAVDADGVHLGQDDVPVRFARKTLNSMCIVGKSTHSLSEASSAAAENPDYIGAGPVASSQTKPGLETSGLAYIREVKKGTCLPFTAIGGINRENARRVIEAGADSLAICGAIITKDNVEEEVTFYRKLIQGEI